MTQNGGVSDKNKTRVNRELTPWLKKRLLESKFNFTRIAAKGKSLGEHNRRLTGGIISRQQSVLKPSSRLSLSTPVMGKSGDYTQSTPKWQALTLLLSQPGRSPVSDTNSGIKRQAGESRIDSGNRETRVNLTVEQPLPVRSKQTPAEAKPAVQLARGKIVQGRIEEDAGDIQKKTADNTAKAVDRQISSEKSRFGNTIVTETKPVSAEVSEVKDESTNPSADAATDAGRRSAVTPHLDRAKNTLNLKSIAKTRTDKVAKSKSDNSVVDGNSSRTPAKAPEAKVENKALSDKPIPTSKLIPEIGRQSVPSASRDEVEDTVADDKIRQPASNPAAFDMKSNKNITNEKAVRTGKPEKLATVKKVSASGIESAAKKAVSRTALSRPVGMAGREPVDKIKSGGSPALMRSTISTTPKTGGNTRKENIKENVQLHNVSAYEQIYDADETIAPAVITTVAGKEVPAKSSSTVSDTNGGAKEKGLLSGESTAAVSRHEIQTLSDNVPVSARYTGETSLIENRETVARTESIPASSTVVSGSIDKNEKTGAIKNKLSLDLTPVSQKIQHRSVPDSPAKAGISESSLFVQSRGAANAVNRTVSSPISGYDAEVSLEADTKVADRPVAGNKAAGLSVMDTGGQVSQKQGKTDLSGTSQVNRMYRSIDLPVQRYILPATPLTRNNRIDSTPVLPAMSTQSAVDMPLVVSGRQKASAAESKETKLFRQTADLSQSETGYYTVPRQAVTTYVGRSAADDSQLAAQTQQAEKVTTDLKALARDIYPYLKRMIMIEKERLPNL